MSLPVTPYNVDARQAVIGGLMLDAKSERASKVFAMLKPESFYIAENGRIFAEMVNLISRNQPIDLMTLDNRLKAVGISEQTGGFAYLAEIAHRTPSAANIVSYAEIVRDEAMKRFTIGKLQDCQALMFEKSALTAQERLEAISRLMNEIADYGRAGKTTGLRPVREVAGEWINHFERFQAEPESVRGLSTGIDALDDLLGQKRLVKQSLVVVGARPKCGKTAFYSRIAGNCVINEKKPALLFSLEMSSKQIFERMLGQTCHLSADSFYANAIELERYGLDSDSLMGKISNAMSELVHDDLLFIDDTPSVSLAHIRNECRRLKRQYGEIGLIGVDYLTLMKAEKAERNDLAYGEITKGLKTLARKWIVWWSC